jgi:hypothetical protein
MRSSELFMNSSRYLEISEYFLILSSSTGGHLLSFSARQYLLVCSKSPMQLTSGKSMMIEYA